jgi:hypothetical protein
MRQMRLLMQTAHLHFLPQFRQLRNIHSTSHDCVHIYLIHSQPQYNKTLSEPRPSCVQVTKMTDSSPTDSHHEYPWVHFSIHL